MKSIGSILLAATMMEGFGNLGINDKPCRRPAKPNPELNNKQKKARAKNKRAKKARRK
jgi:hypothetical protein